MFRPFFRVEKNLGQGAGAKARIHGNIEHPTPIKRERASNAQRRSEGGRAIIRCSMPARAIAELNACSREAELGVRCFPVASLRRLLATPTLSRARACGVYRSWRSLPRRLVAPTCRAKAQRRRAPALREKAEGVQFQPRRGGIFVVERQKTIPAPSRLHFVSARSRRSRRRRRTGAASRFRPDGAGDF
jgi:hypothetical protein